jgi:NADH-quinone oxidoreductase subunit N
VSELSYLRLLNAAAPETIVVAGGLAALLVDLVMMRGESARPRWAIGGAVASLGCVGALLWLVNVPDAARVLEGALVVDPLTRLVKGALLVLGLCAVGSSVRAGFTRHVGEYYALLMLAVAGMMLLAGTEELLLMFLALELSSVSLYVLTAFDQRKPAAAEAGLKYFLIGSVAAAFLLFGLSLLYGLSGATNLTRLAAGLQGKAGDPLLAVTLAMVLVGFGFKVAAVPFHLWAPDAYQGAPLPVAALVASGSKVASFYLLAKLLALGFAGVEGSSAWGRFAPGWMPMLAAVAVASMLLGNVAALAQRDVRRLLAYSAIAHGGYVLVGLQGLGYAAGRAPAMAALTYYLTTYGLTVCGAFGVLHVLERQGVGTDLDALAGLRQRAPFLAWCLAVFLLALAGIPPLAGFFAKFYVFTVAVGADAKSLGLLWLVVLAVAFSTISLYYYLQVLRQAWLPADERASSRLELDPLEVLTLGAAAVGVVVLGAVPELLLGPARAAIRAGGW